MDWTTIIVSIGGSAALFGSLAWLTRSIIVHYLNKDVECFKNALQLKAIEHQVKFNSLYTKRADVIAELYHKLTVADAALLGIRKSEDKTFSEIDRKFAVEICDSCMDALAYFKTNELYFDEALGAKIEHLNVKALLGANRFCTTAQAWEEFKNGSANLPEEARVVEEQLSVAYRMFAKEIPELLTELRKQFRIILGTAQYA